MGVSPTGGYIRGTTLIGWVLGGTERLTLNKVAEGLKNNTYPPLTLNKRGARIY